ncbi:Actin-binding cofilin/tropomyosin type [Penicillium bovifimosum]|uniref:Cofilin n=1 Tax=Penicillium bovifimosum TaxID=126998 RepID=A0A9W9HCI1_9EURO|nr:Actin-binding cofilin/tropomyosin type [Penicillium bovifimosum]KAJ5143944.1 Actin-binding cofilin/tropomyosin type [Penicillium bovifimosum]
MTKAHATITPECEVVFDEVKGTNNLDYVIYQASAHDKKITVAESGKYENYDDFLAHFKDDTPRYAVVKFKYNSPAGDGQRSKLVFITWVPEGASIHDKSYYTSNKDHLFYALLDISLHVQAHTQAELAHATILSKFKAL